jgi:solute carrier family 25 protein 39/40
MYWFGFESLRPVYGRALLPPSSDTQALGFPAYITFLSGATAGMAAAVTTHPFDVLKTRQQVAAWAVTSSSTATAAAASATPASTAAAVLGGAKLTIGAIYRREGLWALYRGLSMRLATVIPASAIMVTIYETIKQWDL